MERTTPPPTPRGGGVISHTNQMAGNNKVNNMFCASQIIYRQVLFLYHTVVDHAAWTAILTVLHALCLLHWLSW